MKNFVLIRTWVTWPSYASIDQEQAISLQEDITNYQKDITNYLSDGYKILSASPFSNGQGSCGVEYILGKE